MQVQIHPSWEKVLKTEFSSPYFQDLIAFVKKEYKNNHCFPPGFQIFNAFDSCPFDQVKAVSYTHLRAHETGALSRMPSSA